MTDREKQVNAFLEKQGAKLCPHRLDADFDIDHGVIIDYIWAQYGCIKAFCTFWADHDNGRCTKAPILKRE